MNEWTADGNVRMKDRGDDDMDEEDDEGRRRQVTVVWEEDAKSRGKDLYVIREGGVVLPLSDGRSRRPTTDCTSIFSLVSSAAGGHRGTGGGKHDE